MKKRVLGFMALLLLVGISTKYVGGTFAKYTSTVTGSGNVTVAKWNFATENATNPVNITVSLPATVDASTLVNGKIAPGTAGSFDVQLTNSTSEVGVDYTIALDSITNIPTNLKFYTDSTYTTELVPGTGTIAGQIAAGDATGVTKNIYWRWAYETPANSTTGDAADTTDGEAARTLTIGLTITGVQTAPGAAITTH